MELSNPALTVAIAMAAGMIAQSLAAHARVPSIMVLLAVGVLLGPDLANVVRPDLLGPALSHLVGFLVAIVLFEGGMNLRLQRLKAQQRAIRQLISVGACVTTLGGAIAAHFILGWNWRLSVLLGTLVIVTGPTVINPLMRRIRVKKVPATVLEAEGVFIDAVGGIVAAVALEVVTSSDVSLTTGVLGIAVRLGFGIGVGLVGGALMAALLKFRHVVPEGQENVLALALALLVYAFSNSVFHESGIAAVTVAGVVVGNSRTFVHRELADFKEQLTVLFIGVLFVLLAADVRIADVFALGVPGLLTVAVLLFVVRPASVAVSTFGTSLSYPQRIFIAWIGPRGIVAAAVASLFAVQLEQADIAGGKSLRALVFLVIASSVLWSGLTGQLGARLLGLQRKKDAGWIVLTANPFARVVASVLQEGSDGAVCIDSNPDAVLAAERQGLQVLLGNALEARTLEKAALETRSGAIGLSSNEEINYLFVERAKRNAKHLHYFVLIDSWVDGLTPGMVEEAGFSVAFGAAVDVLVWSKRTEANTAQIRWWRWQGRGGNAVDVATAEKFNPPYVVIACRRGELVQPYHSKLSLKGGDELALLVDLEREAEVESRLTEMGFVAADSSRVNAAKAV